MNNVICICFNSNYFKFAISFLNSLELNWISHPEVLCHYDYLSEEQLTQLKTYPKVKPIQIVNNTKIIRQQKEHYDFGYVKLKLWSEDYSQYDNLLYLDVDTIILKPLDDLINKNEFTIFKDITKAIFKFYAEGLLPLLKEDNFVQYLGEDLECLDRTSNSGVFLLPKKYRTKENQEYMAYLFNRYNVYDFGDQTLINLWMFKNNFKVSSDVRFNFLYGFLVQGYENFQIEKEAYILHYYWVKPTEPHFFTWGFGGYEGLDKHAQYLFDLYQKYVVRTPINKKQREFNLFKEKAKAKKN